MQGALLYWCHSAVATSSARRYYYYYSLRTAQQISLGQRDDVTPSRYTACSGTVWLPWMLDYCTHEHGMGCLYRCHPYGTAVQQTPALVVHDGGGV
jgi:hypothetical protein